MKLLQDKEFLFLKSMIKRRDQIWILKVEFKTMQANLIVFRFLKHRKIILLEDRVYSSLSDFCVVLLVYLGFIVPLDYFTLIWTSP